MSESKKKKPQGDEPGGDTAWVTEYTHYRTGKVMRASDYGYKAWPIKRKSK